MKPLLVRTTGVMIDDKYHIKFKMNMLFIRMWPLKNIGIVWKRNVQPGED